MSFTRNKSLNRINAGDSIKKFQVKEELAYIPANLYRVSKQKVTTPGLTVLPFRSAANDMSSTVSPGSREISPDALGSSTLFSDFLKPDVLYKTIRTKNVLKVDREHTRVDFSKKSSDVSYLMETKPYLREQRINDHSSHMIKRSLDLLSPKNQSNTVENSILNSSNYKDDKPVSRRGRTNIYLEMKGYGKDPKEDSSLFSDTLKRLKSPVTAETSPERKANVNRSIDMDNNNISRVLPKIVDSSKLGSTIDIPDASDEIRDNFMTKLKKGAIIQKRAQNKNLAVPSGRKEVVTLSDWLATMLEDIQKKKTLGISELFDQTQLIYTVCLEEIIRQVKLQCSERGQILEKIWEAYTDLFNKAVEVSKKEKKQLESHYANEITELKVKYDKEIETHKINIEELTQDLNEKISSLEQETEKREFFEGKSERVTKDLFGLKHELHVAQTEIQKLVNTTLILKSERRATVRGQEQQNVPVVAVGKVDEEITETDDQTEDDASFERDLQRYKERFGYVDREKKDVETETADLEECTRKNEQNGKELLDKSVQYEDEALENDQEEGEEGTSQEDSEEESEEEDPSEKETQIAHSAQEMIEIQNLEEMKVMRDALDRMTAAELRELEKEIYNRIHQKDEDDESGKKSKKGWFAKDKKSKKSSKKNKNKNKDKRSSPGITKDNLIDYLEKYQEDNVYPSFKEIPAEDEMIQFMLQFLKGDEQWKFQDLRHLIKKITKRKAHSMDLDNESLANDVELNADLRSLTGDQLTQNVKAMEKEEFTKIITDLEKKLEEIINGTQQNNNNQELVDMLKLLIEERSDFFEGQNQTLFKKIIAAYEQEINQNMGLRIENKEQYIDLKELAGRFENSENKARDLYRQVEEASEKNQHLRKANEKLTKILTRKKTLDQEAVAKKLQKLDSLMSGYTSGPGIDSKDDDQDTTERDRIASLIKESADNKRSESPAKIKENIADIIKMANAEQEEDWSDSDEKTDRITDREDKPKYLSTKTLSMFANQRKSKAGVFLTKPVDGLTSKKILRVTSINGESANNLLAKAKEKKNIKSVFTKASFLKFMSQFYVDKLKDAKKTQKTPLHVTVYESFMNKYGLKKVAETKCLQIYEAAIAFSETKRIMRFRELLGLGESVEVLEELELYLTTLRHLDPSSGGVLVASNTQEKMFIGLEQAEAVAIGIFESKLDPKSLKELLISLPKIKSLDRASRTVELEDFIDKLFYTQKNLKNTVKGFVKEIFGATDLDNDETLEFFEFNILYKHVEKDRYDKDQVRDLFSENADLILTDGSNEPVISFNKFAWICLEMKLFSEEKQKIFSRVSDASDPVQTVGDLEQNLKQKLNELRLRFLKSKAYTSQIKNIMTKLYSSVKNPQKSRTIVWLSYRLLDEESKVQLLDHEMRMMLPKEFSIIHRFVDEIEGWLDNTHPTEI